MIQTKKIIKKIDWHEEGPASRDVDLQSSFHITENYENVTILGMVYPQQLFDHKIISSKIIFFPK